MFTMLAQLELQFVLQEAVASFSQPLPAEWGTGV